MLTLMRVLVRTAIRMRACLSPQATIAAAHRINPRIVFDIFIHKVDSFSDDQRMESQRDIQNALSEELAAARLSQEANYLYLYCYF